MTYIGPPPELTTAERDALPAGFDTPYGTTIFNTDTQELETYGIPAITSVGWQPLLPQYVTAATKASVIVAEGREIFYDVGASGIMWHFRYTSAFSTYKWAFVGGSAYAVTNNQEGTAASPSYANLTVSGLDTPISVTVPLTGIYEVGISTLASSSSSSTNASIAPSIGGSAPDTNHQALQVGTGTIASYQFGVTVGTGNSVRLQFASSSGTAGFNYSRLWIRPIAVTLT